MEKEYRKIVKNKLILLGILVIASIICFTQVILTKTEVPFDMESLTTSLVEPHNERYEEVSKIARVTCYTDTGLTASGEYVRHGIVAVSDRNISMKSQLYLESFGIMDVRDKTATWVRDKYPVMTIDVWMTAEDCKAFGRKYLTYKLL